MYVQIERGSQYCSANRSVKLHISFFQIVRYWQHHIISSQRHVFS